MLTITAMHGISLDSYDQHTHDNRPLSTAVEAIPHNYTIRRCATLMNPKYIHDYTV